MHLHLPQMTPSEVLCQRPLRHLNLRWPSIASLERCGNAYLLLKATALIERLAENNVFGFVTFLKADAMSLLRSPFSGCDMLPKGRRRCFIRGGVLCVQIKYDAGMVLFDWVMPQGQRM